MYNRKLETFIQIADVGNFSKVAEKLFVSSTAVIKQIYLLEENLGLKLFGTEASWNLINKSWEVTI